ncbi:unnamed protein product, partial [Choristocarpus tenellus]
IFCALVPRALLCLLFYFIWLLVCFWRGQTCYGLFLDQCLCCNFQEPSSRRSIFFIYQGRVINNSVSIVWRFCSCVLCHEVKPKSRVSYFVFQKKNYSSRHFQVPKDRAHGWISK